MFYIKGKNYVHVDGWQFAGGMLGIFPIVAEVKDLSKIITGDTKVVHKGKGDKAGRHVLS